MRMTLKEAQERYGMIDVHTKTWADESKWMIVAKLPDDLLCEHWIVAGTTPPKQVKKFYCNKDMAPALFAALYNVRDRNLQHELKTFDGLFNIRFVRGTTDKPSTHAYGLAIDLNASENPLGGPIKFSQDFAKCFTDQGFTWGGNFSRVDAQHFSWAWE